MRQSLVSLALALSFALSNYAVGAQAATRSTVVYDLPALGPGSGSGVVFADAMQQAAGWSSSSPGALKLDAAGNLRALLPGQTAERTIYTTEAYPAGDYTLLYDGAGTFEFDGGSIVASSPGRATVRVGANAGAGLTLRLTATDAANPVRNVRLVLPGYETTYATQPFVTSYASALTGRGVLRFAQWMHADTFVDSVFWTQRPRVARATQVLPNGVAPEYMILLANLTGSSPWFTLPVGATDAYVSSFAALVHRTLDPRLHPVFQYGNEVWNPSTPANGYARMAAHNVGIPGDPAAAAITWYARRSAQIFALVRAAYGTDASKVVRAISGPLPGSSRNAAALDELLLQSAGSDADAFAFPVTSPAELAPVALPGRLQTVGYATRAPSAAQNSPAAVQPQANAKLVLGTDLPAPDERHGGPARIAAAGAGTSLSARDAFDLHGRPGVTGALGVPLAKPDPRSEGTLDWVELRGASVAARKPSANQLRVATLPDGSLSLSVPGSTRQRVLRVYVSVDRAQGTLTATLGGATFSDSSLRADAGVRNGVYTLVYRAASAEQSLNVHFATSATFGGHASLLAAAIVDVVPRTPPVDEALYHNDLSRSGWNPNESTLTPASVSAGFKQLQTLTVDGNVLAQPLYLSQYSIAGGVHNVLVVATENDTVYEFDADSGALLNHVSLGTSQSSNDVGCHDISPTYGITSTPVINRSTGTIYVVAQTEPTTNNFHTTLHALDIATLADKVTPVDLAASVTLSNGSKLTLNAQNQYTRPGLTWANNSLYIGIGSHCDNDASQIGGWVLRYSSSLSQLAAFSTIGDPTGDCAGFSLSSVWMSGFAPAVDLYGNLLLATGNGAFDANTGGHDYGESVLQLKPDLSGVISYFTPHDYNNLNCGDGDLGSGGVMLLPSTFGNLPQLALSLGKGGTIYLLTTGALGGLTSTDSGAMQVISGEEGGLWGGPAFYSGPSGQFVYYQSNGEGLHAYAVTYTNTLNRPQPDVVRAGRVIPDTSTPAAKLTLSSSGTSSAGYGGSTPVVSSNGQLPNTAIVWLVRRGSGTLYLEAYNALNVNTLLFQGSAGSWSNSQNNGFVTPLVANGKVYVPSTNAVTVFGL